MVNYRVHEKHLSESLYAQFIYENSPVFAGTDDFSLLIRFKYKGDTSDFDPHIKLNDPFHETSNKSSGKTKEVFVHSETGHIDNNGRLNKNSKGDKNDNHETDQRVENDGWFGSRLSTQLSNATRSLFLQSLDNVKEEDPESTAESKDNNNLNLLLGYGQILGYYSINDTIIDFSEKFRDLQKSTIIEGKYAGVNGLNALTNDDIDGGNFLSSINTLFNTELNAISESNLSDHLKFIPFYSTKQNIIFSELDFGRENTSSQGNTHTKSFLISLRLPKDLPPSYFTEAVQINYNFVLGYQMVEGKNIVSKTVFVPLKIQSFIDNYGRQPIYQLQKIRLNSQTENLRIHDVSNHPSLNREKDQHHSATTVSQKRISFWNIKKGLGDNITESESSSQDRRKSNFSISSMSSNYAIDDEITDFLNTLDSLDKSEVNDIIKIQEDFEKRLNESNSFEFNARENLMQILSDYKYVQRQQPIKNHLEDNLEYDYVLPKEQQTRFLIKQDGGLISTVSLNRGIFKLGDLINLDLSFEGTKFQTKGVEIQLLKHQIFEKDEYLKKGNYGEVSMRLSPNKVLETILYEKLFSTFDIENINHDILIPTETEPQFRTNFFSVKYYIQIRFIIVGAGSKKPQDETENEGTDGSVSVKANCDMKNIFIDGTGSMLFRAKENIANANEFYVRIPVVVLPTYEQDFGLTTSTM